MPCHADLIYADDYTADGTSTYDYPAIKGKGYLKVKTVHSATTYQPRYSQAVAEVYNGHCLLALLTIPCNLGDPISHAASSVCCCADGMALGGPCSRLGTPLR